MKWWLLTCMGSVCMLAAGCRAHRSTMFALEQENRQLEDQLYQLSDLLRESRRENQKLRRRLGIDCEEQLPAQSEPGPLPDLPDSSYQQLPKSESGRIASPAVEGVPPVGEPSGEGRLQLPIHPPLPDLRPSPRPNGMQPPLPSPGEGAHSNEPAAPVELATPEFRSSPRDLDLQQRSAAPESLAGPPAQQPIAAPVPQTPQAALPTLGDNRQVASITLNDLVLGGYDEDGRPGDEGVVLLVEPRNASGRIVPAAAPISVVILDPALSGEKARLARWDLSAEVVAGAYRRMAMAEGVYLKLPWPGALPVHSRLHLFVRYVTDDRRNVQTDREIAVEPTPAASPAEARGLVPEAVRADGLPDHPAADTRATMVSSNSRTAFGSTVPPRQIDSQNAVAVEAPNRAAVSREPESSIAAMASVPPAPSGVASFPGDSQRAPASAVRPRPVWTPYR